MLQFVDLEDAIDKMPAELSGGMRRRVGIRPRSCRRDPQIVMFDEPTADSIRRPPERFANWRSNYAISKTFLRFSSPTK